MYMYMCICIRICVYVYTEIYLYMTTVHTYKHIYKHTNMHTHIHTHVQTQIQTHINTDKKKWGVSDLYTNQICICVYMYTYKEKGGFVYVNRFWQTGCLRFIFKLPQEVSSSASTDTLNRVSQMRDRLVCVFILNFSIFLLHRFWRQPGAHRRETGSCL